jgi:murein DD-endopeptidase MepM/ murein hydrolase activator NlpD
MRKRLTLFLPFIFLTLSFTAPQTQTKPFGLPFATPPGPNTWLYGQPYGNTVFAYRQRVIQYGLGQGIHFGIDFPTRCKTPVVAIGNGTVVRVDALNLGAAPHNIVILHDNGYASLYGHLFERPTLQVGQPVSKGQTVGLSGDPDLTCRSRPHLHLEIRDRSFTRAYNPSTLINADWESLALSSPFGVSFARDLSEPRKWQSIDDQPETQFRGKLLNDYLNPFPLDWNIR